MNNPNDNPDSNRTQDNPAVVSFIERLSQEEQMLVVLQKELYEGSWEAMLSDLHNRLDGKPYIFKLANRIRDDIARIHKLIEFETRMSVRLAHYIAPPEV